MPPLRVLVADDDIVSRLKLVRAVRRLGHTALVASDGLQALELFTTQCADVVVTDWLMPGIDGPELCRRVRSSGETSTYTPFIFLTTLDDQQHARQALEIGADDYLYKPLDIYALWARLIVVQRLKQLEGDRQRLLAAERAARADAEAAVRTRDDVLAAVMHDLRTPLTVISASTQLMQRRLARLDIGSLAQPLQCDTERIAAATVRMNQWIDDLVNITPLRGGETVTLRPTTVDLVQRAVDDHHSTTDRHQIGLKTTSASLIGACDESQLRRALDNLLTNAIKYSPDAGESPSRSRRL